MPPDHDVTREAARDGHTSGADAHDARSPERRVLVDAQRHARPDPVPRQSLGLRTHLDHHHAFADTGARERPIPIH